MVKKKAQKFLIQKSLSVKSKNLLGLKVISVVLYILSALLLLSALWLLFFPLPMLNLLFSVIPTFVYLLYPLGLIIPFGGEILLLAFAVLLFFQGKWLWKRERRAKHLVLILSVVDAYLALATMTTMDLSPIKVIIEVIVAVSIALYLIWLLYSERKKN